MNNSWQQLEFDFIKPEWYTIIKDERPTDFMEFIEFHTFDNPAHINPCSSCPNSGKGPCFCTRPNLYNGPIY